MSPGPDHYIAPPTTPPRGGSGIGSPKEGNKNLKIRKFALKQASKIVAAKNFAQPKSATLEIAEAFEKYLKGN